MQLSSKNILEHALEVSGGGSLLTAIARGNTLNATVSFNLGISGNENIIKLDETDNTLVVIENSGIYEFEAIVTQYRASSSQGNTTGRLFQIKPDGTEIELDYAESGANDYSIADITVVAWGYLEKGDKVQLRMVYSGTKAVYQQRLVVRTVGRTDVTMLPPVIHSGKLVSATFRTTAPEAFPVILDGPATGTAGLASPKDGGGLTVETTGEYEVEVLLDRLRAASSGSLDFSANLKVNGTIYDSSTVRIINTSSRYIKLVYGGLLKAGDVITVDGVESASTSAGGPSLITLKTVIDGESTHLRDYPYQGNDYENTEFPVGCVIQAWMPETYNDRTKLWSHHTLYCWSGTTAVYLTEERTETKGPKLNGVWAFVGEIADIANKPTGSFLRIR